MKNLTLILALFLLIGGINAQNPHGRSLRNQQDVSYNIEDFLNSREIPNNNFPKTSMRNFSEDAQDISEREVVASGTEFGTLRCIDASSTQNEFTTYSRKVWWNGYYIDSVKYTLYSSNLTEDISFTIRTDTMLTNDVRVLPEYSRYMFNSNANREFMVMIHYFYPQVGPNYQHWKHLVINEQGAAINSFENTDFIALYHNGQSGSTRKVITSQYDGYIDRPLTNEDTSTFKVFSIGSVTGSSCVISEQAEHRIGTKNLVAFQAPIFDIKTIGNNTYYYFPHYQEPFLVGTPMQGQSTPDNKGMVKLYNISNSALYKEIELPMPNWSNMMQIELGTGFSAYDMTRGIFGDGEKLDVMYGLKEYRASCDCYENIWMVVNEDGEVLKTMDRKIYDAGVQKMADVAGETDMYALYEPAAQGGVSAVSMFDIRNWQIKTTFQAIHNGEKLTLIFNRIPYQGSFAYLFTMDEVVSGNGTRYQPINYYNIKGEKIKTLNFDMGPQGIFFNPIFSNNTLNPYLFNASDALEFVGFARTYTSPSQSAVYSSIYVYSEEGKLLYKADDNAGGYGKLAGPQGIWSTNGGKTFDYFRLTYSDGTSYFYQLPFALFEAGEGTQENPYLISDAGHLDAVRYYPGAHYKVVNDIDMKPLFETKYKNIGWEAIPDFTGSIDGQDFTIKNLKITDVQGTNASLFALLKNNAVIKNLRIENGEIIVNKTNNAKIAFVAGSCEKESSIKNVHVTGTIKSAVNLGTNVAIGSIAASMMGETSGTGPLVQDCSFTGTIETIGNATVSGFVGGIVGEMRMNPTVKNCFSKGTINLPQSGTAGVGGIVGQMRSISFVNNCYSTADITGIGNVGGIVGYFNEQTKMKGTMENCYASGRIMAVGANNTHFAGGVVGSSSDNNAHLVVNFQTMEVSVVKTTLTMSGLIALNDSVTTSSQNQIAKRVIGINSKYNDNINTFGAATADSIRYCYALSNVVLGNSTTYNTVTSEDPSGMDGADITAPELTEPFLTEIGWKFGNNTQNPWVWMEGKYPKLWFEVLVQSVVLDADEITIYIDDTHLLTVTVLPEYAVNKNVTWKSNDQTMATVNNGLVTAVAEGTTTITVTTEEGGFTATCVVNVLKKSSIETVESASFNIYPNPVTDVLTIERTNADRARIEIFNSAGALLKTFETNDIKTQLNVNNLPSGIYLIRCSDDRSVVTQRFLK